MTEDKKEAPQTKAIEVKGNSFVSVYVNRFDEGAAKEFFNQFEAAKQNDQRIVPVYIDSYGGYVDSLSVMLDTMISYPGEVLTLNIGKSMSCGSILLACGSPGMRYSAPNARVMVHNVSSVSWGKLPDLEVSTTETKRLEQQVFRLMAKRCGQPTDYFLNLLKAKGYRDIYMTPEDARKHKIIDYIKYPIIRSEPVMKITIK